MLYTCSTKRQQTGRPFEDHKLQQAELARHKRENTQREKSGRPKKAVSLLSTRHLNYRERLFDINLDEILLFYFCT